METLNFILAGIIGILGTWFLLYYLRTRNTLKLQHALIMSFTELLVVKGLKEDLDKKEAAPEKPCECNTKGE